MVFSQVLAFLKSVIVSYVTKVCMKKLYVRSLLCGNDYGILSCDDITRIMLVPLERL
jgi:hypothetical protein